jgi:hypothetical protein
MEMWTVEIQQKNGEWFNYFVDEGLWWDTCWFQTEEEALSEFWKIMNEYDANYEVSKYSKEDDLNNDYTLMNDYLLTVLATSTDPESDFNYIYKFRVFACEPYNPCETE